MEQPVSRLAFLFSRYTAGACTNEERDEYLELVKKEEYAAALALLISGVVAQEEGERLLTKGEIDRIWQQIRHSTTPVIPLSYWQRYRKTWWAAAVILLLVFVGGIFYFPRKPQAGKMAQSVTADKNIVPGGNKAVLTLANGTAIILDSVGRGLLVQQGNSQVVKTDNGQLAYTPNNEKPTNILYNMLATPRGGQYRLVLPDGSRVWLNAASSIRYPTAFTGENRLVDITGEVYFEVAKDVARPFIVRMGSPGGYKGEIAVMGTHFNVNAYDDEPAVRASLLEGGIRVKNDAATAVLKPGEQARLTKSGGISVVEHADMEEAIAWKNGYFSFNGADIEMIMRQVSRWYDVDVSYEGKIPNGHFRGRPGRDLTISEMLQLIEYGGVKCRVEGRRIIVRE